MGRRSTRRSIVLVVDRGRRRGVLYFPLEDFGDLPNNLVTCGIFNITLEPCLV